MIENRKHRTDQEFVVWLINCRSTEDIHPPRTGWPELAEMSDCWMDCTTEELDEWLTRGLIMWSQVKSSRVASLFIIISFRRAPLFLPSIPEPQRSLHILSPWKDRAKLMICMLCDSLSRCNFIFSIPCNCCSIFAYYYFPFPRGRTNGSSHYEMKCDFWEDTLLFAY